MISQLNNKFPFTVLNLQTLRNKMLRPFRELLVFLRARVNFTVHDSVQVRFFVPVILVRLFFGQGQKESDASGPGVQLFVQHPPTSVHVVVKHLRGHVTKSANDQRKLPDQCIAMKCSENKV